jgi:hypothetical protein
MMPATIEDEPVAVAIAVSALLQLPPVDVSKRVSIVPAQKIAVPVIGAALGKGTTYTVRTAVSELHELVETYFILVCPRLCDVNSPEVFMDATLVSELNHIPPAAESIRLSEFPRHISEDPEIVPAWAKGLTVKVKELDAVPQRLVTWYVIVVVPG